MTFPFHPRVKQLAWHCLGGVHGALGLGRRDC